MADLKVGTTYSYLPICPRLTQYNPVIKLISMFRGSSWIQRAGVALLLLASLGAGVTAPPHADDRDAECSPVPVAHDASAHSIRASSKPAPLDGGHCFLCHSLRSFYSAFDKYEHHHDGPQAERLHIATLDRAFIVDWTLVPGRAPPA